MSWSPTEAELRDAQARLSSIANYADECARRFPDFAVTFDADTGAAHAVCTIRGARSTASVAVGDGGAPNFPAAHQALAFGVLVKDEVLRARARVLS